MRFFKNRLCKEAECMVKYINDLMDGKESEDPCVEYPDYQEILQQFEKLFESEKQMGSSTVDILKSTSSLSNFDVGMSFIADKLINFSEEMSQLSESNVAIVEETNASMTQVNSAVGNAADTLSELTSSSENLVTSNNQGLQQLFEVAELKEEVLRDASAMKDQIDQLVNMTNSITEIVNGVNAIAEQTNLLALNASIEAARAGEYGRGFAVVADEIRKLADDTKSNLEGMNKFVDNINTVAEEGKDSMDRTIGSTNKMSGEIDNVIKTMEDNVKMLSEAIENIVDINNSMEGITLSTDEIRQAMDSSSADAERLSHMTMTIHEDALTSKNYSEVISVIDEELFTATRDMMQKLSGGRNDLTNNQIIKIIDDAIDAHKAWIINLEVIVNKEQLAPIEVRDTKCSFGHFYHSLNITNPSIKDEWASIDNIHHDLHSFGGIVLDAIESNDISKANTYLSRAKDNSKKMIEIFNNIKEKLRKS